MRFKRLKLNVNRVKYQNIKSFNLMVRAIFMVLLLSFITELVEQSFIGKTAMEIVDFETDENSDKETDLEDDEKKDTFLNFDDLYTSHIKSLRFSTDYWLAMKQEKHYRIPFPPPEQV